MSRIATYQSKSIRHNGKTNRIRTRALAALSAAAAMVGWSSFVKADTYSNNGGANLSLAGSWVDDTSPATDTAPPSTNDIAQFDSLVGATSSFDLGQASTSWLGLNVTNPGAAVTIDDSGLEAVNSLTLGASGINVGSQSLTINDGVNIGANQTWSVASGQNLTVNGIITGSANTLTFTGAGSSVLTGSSAYTGSVATNATNLTLDFSGASAPVSNILNSGSTLQLGGGSFNMKVGATNASQTVTSTTVLPGITTINLTSAGAGVPTLNLGTFTFPATSAGAAIVINGVPVCTAASISFATAPTNTNANGTLTILNPANLPGTVAYVIAAPGGASEPGPNGLVIAASNGTTGVGGSCYATVGLYDWAAVTGAGPAYDIVGGSTIPNFYQPFGSVAGTVTYSTYSAAIETNDITNQFTGNADIVANIGTHNTDTIDSIRFNTPGTVLVNGVPTLTVSISSSILSAGGILETPNVGASDITFSGTAQDLGMTRNASGGAALMLYQNNTLGLMNINTGFGNEHDSDALVQSGSGSVVFGGISAYLGSTYLNGGMTEIGNNCDLGTLTAPIFLQGGAVVASQSLNLDNGGGTTAFRPVTLAGSGGTLAAIVGTTMNVDGVVSGTGSLEIGIATLTGTGLNTAHTLAQVGSGTVELTGVNTYVGNTIINQGALQIDTVGVATGTGAIIVNSSGGIVGTGSVVGNVTSGGQIIPGDAGKAGNVGNFTVNGNLVLNTGSASVFNTNGITTGLGASEVVYTGLLTDQPDSGVTLYDPNSVNSLNINGTYDLFAGNTSDVQLGNFVVTDPATNPGTHEPLTYTFTDTVNPGYVAVIVAGGPATSSWTNPGGGSWGNPGNWLGGIVPHNPGDIVTLGPVGNAPITITLDAPNYPTLVPTGVYSMGQLTFNNSNGYTVDVGTGGSMAFDQGSLTTVATVTDDAGTQALNVPVALNSNTTVTINRAGDTLTFGSTVSGLGSLTIVGPGAVNLFASNTYSGVTSINSGTVFVGDGTVAHNSNLGSGGATITNNGTLVFNNTNVATIYGALIGTGTITQAGSGSLVLAGAGATFTGPLNVNGGTIQLAAENALGSPSSVTFNAPALLDLNGNDQTLNNLTDNNSLGKTVIDDVAGGATSTLTINNTANATFSGIIQNTSGTVNLVESGAGILVLADTNTYAGTTTITGGGLQLNANNTINPASVITVESTNGLNLGNGVTIANPITVNDSANEFETTNGGSATLTGVITVSGGAQFRPGSPGGTITFTNSIGESGDEIFVEGMTILTGTATLTGTSGGLTSIGRSTNAAGLTIEGNASFTSLQTAGATSSNIGLYVGSDDSTNGENPNLYLTLQGNGVINLGQSGMDLDSDPDANQSSPQIEFNGGTLSLANFVTSEPYSPQVSFNGTDVVATASDNTNGTASLFFPNLSSQGDSVVIGTGGFILNNGGFSITIAQELQGQSNPNDGGLTISGAGTVTMANVNNFNGNTSVTAGELRFSSALNNNQVVGFQGSNVVLSPGAQIDLNASLAQVGGLSGSGVVDNLEAGTATLILNNQNNGNASSSFAGTIQNSLGAASAVQVDVENGTFALTGVNTYTGGTAINGGVLAISSDAAVNYGTDVNGPGLYYGGGFNNQPSGIYVDNNGTLQFNNYASTLTLTGNNIGLGAALGSPSSLSTSFTDGGDLNYNGPGVLELLGTPTINGSVNLNNGSLGIGSDAAIDYGQNGLNFNNTGALQFDNYTSTLSFSNGNVNLGAAIGAPSTLTGNITANQLTFVGPGTLILAGTGNTYGGGTFLTGGSLGVASDTEIPGGATAITFNGGALQFDNYASNYSFSNVSNLALGAATGAASTLNGTISGSSNLTFVGPGTLVLAVANTYSGTTTITGGTLSNGVNNALPTGTTLNVDDPAAITGTYNLNGHTQTVADVTMNGGSIVGGTLTSVGGYSLQAGSASANLAGGGSLTVSGPGVVTLSGSNSYTGGTSVTGGELIAGAANALPTDHSLSIGSAGAVALSTIGSGLTVNGTSSSGGFNLSSLSMSTGAVLDLGSNAVTIHYGGTDPVSAIASYLSTGFASGGIHGWGGTAGIVSTTVASLNSSQSALIYSVGYADGADGINPGIPSGEIEIMPTLAGDAKMQGNVVFGDFQLLSQYFGDANTSWDEGDFTYNGTTNFGDFQLLSQNFGASTASLTSGELASINSFAAQLGEQYVSTGSGYALVSVPEPASIGLLGLAGASLLARRRRRQSK